MSGGITVIKVGGELAKAASVGLLAAEIASLTRNRGKVIVVHGGGPQATALQKALGQTPNVVGGRRITDAAALEVMKMAVAGEVNVNLCSALIGAGARPVGLHGGSSCAVKATRRPPRVVSGGGPDPIDFGHVGDVAGFNLDLLKLLLEAEYVPVIACLAATEEGAMLNINADIVANQLARELGAAHLVLVTSARGVLRDVDDPSSRIATLNEEQARKAIEDGVIQGGMIPKIEESLRVLRAGVESIHIVGHLAAGELAREVEKPGSVGTALIQ